MVNDQLNQLYVEMELEGLSTRLTLEEGITSSSSGGEENNDNLPKVNLRNEQTAVIKSINELQQRRKKRSYSSLVMIYEENAPLPSPNHLS